MRSFKKLIASISSLVMCLSLVPVGANATTSYLKGDVNGDGVVNGSDSLALSNFLNGQKSAADGAMVERLDVNRNYVIDHNDLTALNNINLGISNSISLNSVATTELPSQENRLYYVYNTNGVFTDSYTLYASDVPNISTNSSRYVIDTNEREPENGLQGVVKLSYDNSTGTGTKVGTGFVVDSHTILTAAHCLYDDTNHKGVTNLKISFYDEYNQKDTSISATPVSYHIPYNYTQHNSTNNYYDDYDYALITVQQDLSQYINFNLGVLRDDVVNYDPEIELYATGFGGDHSESATIGTKYTCYGTLATNNPVRDYTVYYDNDSVGGDSGGPVYINSNGNKTAIALFTTQDNVKPYEYNFGTRITTDILHFVYNNSHLSY